MTSKKPKYPYHIARRVESGARPSVSNQAGVEKSATGSNFNFDCQVVIAPINLHELRRVSANNLANLHLPLPSSTKRTFRQPCPNIIDQPGPSNMPSNRHKQTTSDVSSIKHCHVCKVSLKGRRGLELHLNRSPNCKRNVPISLPSDLPSLPREIINTVKSPSTSVESLNSMCGDGKNTKISPHKNGLKHGCKNCPRFSTKDKFVSTSTHRIHHSIIPDNVGIVDCNSANVIYLITCQRCRLQYVGETIQPLRGRIGSHFSSMNHPDKDHTCRILSDHFHHGHCKGAQFSVNIVEKLPGDGRLPPGPNKVKGDVDPALACLRRKKETDWMLKLFTHMD